MIYHILTEHAWESAADPYEPASFSREGFIHCSKARQVEAIANEFFADAERPIVLELEEGALGQAVRREDLDGRGQEYPHIYGSIPRSAVARVLPLLKGSDGRLRLPAGSVPGAASAADVRLRRAEADDASRLARFRYAMFQDMHPDTDYSAIRDALISGSEDYYRRHAGDQQCIIIVAQAVAGLVGCAGLIVEEKPPHAKRLRNISGYVLSVYVEAEYRGRGIARALMERIREEAIARGVTRLALHASSFGMPLYRSLGYVQNPSYLELDLTGGP